MEKGFDDNDIQLVFVNKKASKRVREVIDEIKASFLNYKIDVDEAPMNSANKIDENLELLFCDPHFIDFKKDIETVTQFPHVDHLKPFPSFPASYPYLQKDAAADLEYHNQKRNFLVNSRKEHHKILKSFQEKIISEICQNADENRISPFKMATTQIAHEQNLPIHFVSDSNESSIQEKKTQILQDTQEKVKELIESQDQQAKLIHDTKQFDIYMQQIQNQQARPQDNPPIPVEFPYQFLIS